MENNDIEFSQKDASRSEKEENENLKYEFCH